MSTMTINGRTIEVPDGANISVVSNQVFINGEPYEEDSDVKYKKLVIEGNVGSVTSDKRVEVKGDVGADVNARGSVTCDAVGGSVRAGGSVTCDGVGGNVSAGGSITSL